MNQLRLLVGKNIRLFRTRKGYTQEQLAVHSEIDPYYISKLENGRVNVSLDTMEKLCKVLDIEPILLLKEDN